MSDSFKPPKTWLMLGHRAGDNSQIKALAEALGWPVETKHLVYRKTELLTNLFAGPTLAGLVKEKSSKLEPPWPELIISAGRRNEPLVRWIQQQAGRDNVKLVHVGRPWALHECFDLIVTTPQYRLENKPNILQNEAPLHLVTNDRIEQARPKWEPKLAHLPKPQIAVILGGSAGPYIFDRETGALIGYHASQMAKELGGSLLVTSSARTPAKAIDALAATLDVPASIYRWSRDDPDNPYFGFLACAERLIVTSDSMSMLVEAEQTGKPVYIFDMLRGKDSKRPPLPTDKTLIGSSPTERLQDFRPQPFFFRLGLNYGPTRLTRDVSRIHKRQVEAGRAVWLGDTWPQDRTPTPVLDLDRAVVRVKELFSDTPPERPKLPESRLPEFLQRFLQ